MVEDRFGLDMRGIAPAALSKIVGAALALSLYAGFPGIADAHDVRDGHHRSPKLQAKMDSSPQAHPFQGRKAWFRHLHHRIPRGVLNQFGLPPSEVADVASSWDFGQIATPGTFGVARAYDPDYPQYDEVIIFDGIAYTVDEDTTELELVPRDLETDYASVARFDPDASTDLSAWYDSYDILQDAIEAILPSTNNLYVIMIHGTFDQLELAKARGPAPGPGDLFTLDNVEGTMVGLYAPSLVGSLAEIPFHFHFLTDDVTAMGHVYDLSVSSVLELQYMQATTFLVHWPDSIVTD